MSEVTSDGNHAMYPQLKRSLEHLIEEFRHLSLKYGPIYHELFKAWDEERTTKESWKAFVKAEVPEKEDEDEWDQWGGPTDGKFYGRFYGDESGMDEFAVLAESTFLTLCEFDADFQIASQYRRTSDGLYGWMDMLHDMGFKYPTSLLCSENSVWSVDESLDLDDLESYVCQWEVGDDKTPYPKYPLCWRLVHNVFISSIAALRIIIEPEMALLVGNMIDDLPIPRQLPTAPDQELLEPVEAIATEQHEGPFWMKRIANGYYLSYKLGDTHDSNLFDKLRGLDFIYALFQQPGKVIPIGEMERYAGVIGRPSKAVPIGKMDLHAGHPIDMITTFRDEAMDREGIEKIQQRLKEVEELMKEEMEQAAYDEAEEEVTLLKKYLAQVARYPQSPDPGRQTHPKIVDKTYKKMADKIRKAINDARHTVGQVMPNCGKYLWATVDYERMEGWIYDPMRAAPLTAQS